MAVSVDSTFESIKPSVEQFVSNNNAQFEQVACTVRDTVEDVFKVTSKNFNDFFNNEQVNSNASENPFGPKLDCAFITDVTIPDGTVLEPSTNFTKSWKIKNSGETAWPKGCSLQFVGGDRINQQHFVPVGAVPAGETVDVSIQMKTPQTPGKYACYFRLCCPVNGAVPFGDRLWCEVVAEETFEYKDQLKMLVDMGFDSAIAKVVLQANNGNLDNAIVELLN